MKKIMLLTTGGTIASVDSQRGLIPGVSGEDMLGMLPEVRDICQIDSKGILSLDSTNIQPSHWQLIAEEVYGALWEYDGVVIAHGTDTMAYTAAALGWMLQNLGKPVVFTGAQIPMSMENSDGPRNLVDAITVASQNLPGIWVVFHGRILPGASAHKMYTDKLDAFRSLNRPQMGEVRDKQVEIFYMPEIPCGEMRLDTALNSRVFLLRLIPGLSPDIITTMVDAGYEGIIIEGYGCGGVPGKENNLLPAIRDAISRGVTVMLNTQCEYDGVDLETYEVGIQAAKAGVISAEQMTSEAAVTYLMWKLAHMKS